MVTKENIVELERALVNYMQAKQNLNNAFVTASQLGVTVASRGDLESDAVELVDKMYSSFGRQESAKIP